MIRFNEWVIWRFTEKSDPSWGARDIVVARGEYPEDTGFVTFNPRSGTLFVSGGGLNGCLPAPNNPVTLELIEEMKKFAEGWVES